MANEATSSDSSPPPPQGPANLSAASKIEPASNLRASNLPLAKSSPSNSRNASPARKPSSQPQIPHVSAYNRPPSQAAPPSSALQRGVSGLSDMQRKDNPSPSTSRSQASTAPSSPLLSIPPSPRIKSPPPTASRRSSVSSVKLSDSESTEGSRPSRSTNPSKPTKDAPAPDRSPSPTQTQQLPPPKAPRGPTGRGPKLETVQEGDHSASPKEQSALARRAEEEDKRPTKDDTDATPKRSATAPKTLGTPSEHKQAMPTTPSRKRSTSSLAGTKSRTSANEGSSKVMTVETETVSTIPQAAMNSASDRAAGGRGDGSGALRGRASHETIRPKKEKKKIVRKPQSTTAGDSLIIPRVRNAQKLTTDQGSSKADIFEAKVASEIEGEDSESDETFVYESKPAEPRSRQRHHSRTPSITSTSTLNERKPGLPRGGPPLHSTDRPVKPKRSMKFVSGGWTGSVDDENSDRDGGTVRTPHSRGNLRRDLHGRRLGRNEGAYDSSVDSESPFSQASKLRITPVAGSRASVKSGSPGSRTPTQTRSSIKKGHSDLEYDSGFDERTPLIASAHRQKRHARHPRHSQLEDLEYEGQRSASWLRRLACFILTFLLVTILVILGAGMLYLAARPLRDVSAQGIRNVLASEQEIMLDLVVKATNPNIVQINIKDMDVNVFAKSRHVGDESLYYNATKGIDEGTDPIEDPEGDHQTMLLGRIFHFDSALSFDPSPLRREPQRSAGELRLARPGNRTETGGSARWERVLQHQFVLIVRGVLQYELPLSTQMRTASVGAKVLVKPEDGTDDKGNMHVVQLDHLPPVRENGLEVVEILPGAPASSSSV